MKHGMKATPKAKATMKRPAAASVSSEVDALASQLSCALTATQSTKEKLSLLRGIGDQMTTQEKIDMMQKSLSHDDWKKLHGQFKTAASHDSELHPGENASNQEKKTSLMGWVLDPSKGEVFQGLKHKMTGTMTLMKKDQWVSYKRITKDWTDDELNAHLETGRVLAKECPDTPGVWVYQDTNNVVRSKVIDRSRSYTKKSTPKIMDAETKEDDEAEHGRLWNRMGTSAAFQDADLFGIEGKGSSSSSKGRGKGKLALKGKGHGQPLPIEDDPVKKLNGAKTQLKAIINKCMTAGYDNVKVKNKLKPTVAKLQKLMKEAETKAEDSTDKVKAFCADVQAAVKEAKSCLE